MESTFLTKSLLMEQQTGTYPFYQTLNSNKKRDLQQLWVGGGKAKGGEIVGDEDGGWEG